jgi:integrase
MHAGALERRAAVGRLERRVAASKASTAGLDPQAKPNLRFHDLRHTFASLLVAQGSNVVFISRKLGHASADITLKVYAHLFDAAEDAERATSALEQGFAAALDGNHMETEGVPRTATH